MASQKQWKTSVTVTDAVGPMVLGLADKWTGASKTSDPKLYPRARGDLRLKGKATREDGKATFLFADIRTFAKRLDAAVNNNARATVTRYEVGDDEQPLVGGETYTLVGEIKSFPLPEGDAGGEDGATVEIDFTLERDLA